jgi:tight adherence protein B
MSPVLTGILAAGAIVALVASIVGVVRQVLHRRVRERLTMPSRPSVRFGLPGDRFSNEMAVVFLAVAFGGFALVIDGGALAVLTVAMVLVLSWAIRRRQHQARLRVYNRDVVRVLDGIVLRLRSGAGLISALREVAVAREGAVEADLREIVRQLDFGVSLDAALSVWLRRCPLRSVRLTIAGVRLAHETGGSSAQSIAAVRATVRNAIAVEVSVQTHAAQAQASATALVVMPFALSGPMLACNETARLFMLHTPIGLAILLTGLLFDLAGMVWMSKLITGVSS